jgi:glucokinase
MYLAVDIGGTKTLLACFTAEGTLAQSRKFATPVEYGEFMELLGRELGALGHHKFESAAVAVPARLDRHTGIAIAFGNRPWRNVPIKSDLQRFIPCPIALENDTKLAGLSEASLVHDFRKVLYVTISTGINSALVIDGKLDADTADSETGQLLLEHNGRLMDWEDFASGRAFAERFGKRVSDIAPDDQEAWYYIARNIAVGLVNLIAVYSPEVIVLGGGVGVHLDKFRGRLEEQLKIYENPLVPLPPIRQAQRAGESVIYGCYMLAHQTHGPIITHA